MDYEVVILKPAELILKSKQVRKKFETILLKNIKQRLRDKCIEFDHIIKGEARYFVYTPEPEEVIKELKQVPGISKLYMAVEVGAKLSALKFAALELAKGLTSKKSFGVRVRAINSNLSAREIEADIGRYIGENTRAKVNLTNPDLWIKIEIIGKKAFLFTEEVKGVGGLPVGVSGKVVCLMNSPEGRFAAKMMEQRGCEVIPAYSENLERLKKRVKEKRARALVLPSLMPSFIKAEFPIFEPLLPFSKKELKNLIEKSKNS